MSMRANQRAVEAIHVLEVVLDRARRLAEDAPRRLDRENIPVPWSLAYDEPILRDAEKLLAQIRNERVVEKLSENVRQEGA